jgi:hypothetical protein
MSALVRVAFLVLAFSTGWIGHVRAQADPVVVNGILLPERVKGLDRGLRVDFEEKRPGYGTGISYRSPSSPVFADIYIYDKLIKPFPEDVTAAPAKAELAASLQELKAAEKLGFYRGVSVKNLSIVLDDASGRPDFLLAEIGLERDQQKFDSIILLGVRNAKFLKLRFTTPPHQGSAKEAIDFVKAVLSGRAS